MSALLDHRLGSQQCCISRAAGADWLVLLMSALLDHKLGSQQCCISRAAGADWLVLLMSALLYAYGQVLS